MNEQWAMSNEQSINEHFVLLEHLAADFAEILENVRTA